MARWARIGWAANVLIVVVSGLIVNAAHSFWTRLHNPPLMVTTALAQLGAYEALAEVTSINMRLPDMWSRLWANAFLLRKAQYFSSETYEGRAENIPCEASGILTAV